MMTTDREQCRLVVIADEDQPGHGHRSRFAFDPRTNLRSWEGMRAQDEHAFTCGGGKRIIRKGTE